MPGSIPISNTVTYADAVNNLSGLATPVADTDLLALVRPAGVGSGSYKMDIAAFKTWLESFLAALADAVLTGTPQCPTATPGTNTDQIASTAFVHNAVGSKVNINDIVDNLTSLLSNAPLSAGQGKILKDQIDTKLNSADYNQLYKGTHVSLAALQTAYPTATSGQYAIVDTGGGSPARQYLWDVQDGWVLGSDTAASTTDGLAEGLLKLYFTTQRAIDAGATAFVRYDQVQTLTAGQITNVLTALGLTTALLSGDLIVNLTSISNTKPLAASQGKALKDLIDILTTTVAGKASTSYVDNAVSGASVFDHGARSRAFTDCYSITEGGFAPLVGSASTYFESLSATEAPTDGSGWLRIRHAQTNGSGAARHTGLFAGVGSFGNVRGLRTSDGAIHFWANIIAGTALNSSGVAVSPPPASIGSALGLVTTATSLSGTNAICFVLGDNNANIRCVVGATNDDSGVALVAGNEYKLYIKVTTSQVLFYINSVLVATVNSGIPTGLVEGLIPGVVVSTNTDYAGYSVLLDLIDVQQIYASRRTMVAV